MDKIKWIIISVLVFVCLGYFREFFFVHLNNILYYKYYNSVSALPIPGVMKLFDNFSYSTLYYLKYPFTLLSTILFFFASYLTLKKLTGNRQILKILFYVYALLLILAGISMIYGYFINQRLQDDEYTISRWLMGIAQSPIICLILLASEKLYTNQLNHD
jgi:hypothetical protein